MERLELQQAIPTFEPNLQICEAVSLFQLFYSSLFHLRKSCKGDYSSYSLYIISNLIYSSNKRIPFWIVMIQYFPNQIELFSL
jgi:hypothetical protein